MASDARRPIFECTMCGDCCRGFGGTYLTDNDIEAIAAHLGLSRTAFVTEYCTLSGKRYLLAQGEDGFCIFYKQKCAIHAIKPRMCRTWPYLRSVLVDFSNWTAMASMCPGIRADAPQARVKTEISAHHRIVLPD